jgi:hypothetical protein
LYDFFKHNFNVLDCIDNLPHFSKMLQAFALSEETIKQHTSRSRAMLEQSRQAYMGDRISNYAQKVIRPANPDAMEGDPDAEPLTRNYKAFNKKPYGPEIQRKAGRFYDDFILSEWIKEYGKDITIIHKPAKGAAETITLTTNEGIVKFAEFMAR